MHVNWPDNFEELYKKRGSQKYGIRLLALWKIQSGMTETAVCQFLRKTHKTIHQWRCLYETGGVEALLSIKPGRGRKARLRDSHCFEQSLEALSQERQGGRLRCQDIAEMVKQRYESIAVLGCIMRFIVLVFPGSRRSPNIPSIILKNRNLLKKLYKPGKIRCS